MLSADQIRRLQARRIMSNYDVTSKLKAQCNIPSTCTYTDWFLVSMQPVNNPI